MKKNAIPEELETIRQQHKGLLKPRDVVEFAKDPQTALHNHFLWDNSKAAHQYRLWQARQIIRITVTIAPGTKIEDRVFVSLMDDRKKTDGGYRTTIDVMSDAEQKTAMLTEALAELNVFRRKYARLTELSKVFAAIDAATEAAATNPARKKTLVKNKAQRQTQPV